LAGNKFSAPDEILENLIGAATFRRIFRLRRGPVRRRTLPLPVGVSFLRCLPALFGGGGAGSYHQQSRHEGKKPFETVVIEGLCRGVSPDTTGQALEEMAAMGIQVK
jgi:hypothetical protein